MEFSSDIMMEFGLNLAGYIIVAVTTYWIATRSRKAKGNQSGSNKINTVVNSEPIVRKTSTSPVTTRADEGMEYISFANIGAIPVQSVPDLAAIGQKQEQPETETPRPVSRQENRRAIYREARRLLARGKSNSDLMQQLPLTEDEVEMLSMAPNA
jgi:type IV secretory pathway VirB10-like protein